jgi:tRNA (uracil-5-)-methyltransferase
VEQTVEDARGTAAFSGITNCEFHTGRAEKILPRLLKSKKAGQLIVAVVNPVCHRWCESCETAGSSPC